MFWVKKLRLKLGLGSAEEDQQTVLLSFHDDEHFNAVSFAGGRELETFKFSRIFLLAHISVGNRLPRGKAAVRQIWPEKFETKETWKILLNKTASLRNFQEEIGLL